MAEKKKAKRKDGRNRNWVFILYPDECYENWKNILRENGVNYICSPLHDKDIDSDGTKKKTHYHVILYFSGNKSYSQIWGILKKLGENVLLTEEELKTAKPNEYSNEIESVKIRGVAKNPQAVDSMVGHIRYFIHLDNPEKYQYNREDIEVTGPYDPAIAFKRREGQEDEILVEIINFIEENNITNYWQFFMMCKSNKEWVNLMNHNFGFSSNVSNLIKARYWYKKESEHAAPENKGDMSELLNEIEANFKKE